MLRIAPVGMTMGGCHCRRRAGLNVIAGEGLGPLCHFERSTAVFLPFRAKRIHIFVISSEAKRSREIWLTCYLNRTRQQHRLCRNIQTVRFHRIRTPLVWIHTPGLLLSEVSLKSVVFRARFSLLWFYITYVYMPFLGVVIGFFCFIG